MSPNNLISKKNWILSKSLTIAGLSLALCAAALPTIAQQGQSGKVRPTATGRQDAQPQGQQDSQSQEKPNAPTQLQPDSQAPAQQDSQGQDQVNQIVPPQTLTLPAGTTIRIRVDEWLSSDRNLPGDSFSAVLDRPIVVDGWVVARRGQAETGQVSSAKKAGRMGATSELGVGLPVLTLVDGQQLPLQTQLIQSSAGASHGREAATIGTTTGAGAVIGAIAEGGAGAAIGAGVGAAAGLIGVLATRGKPTVIPPETVLSFRLQAPVTVSTEKSQFAFQPVTQADYDSHEAQDRPRRTPPNEQPAPYYGYPFAYGYPYPYAFYPGPFGFGFYGGYGGFGGYRGGFRR